MGESPKRNSVSKEPSPKKTRIAGATGPQQGGNMPQGLPIPFMVPPMGGGQAYPLPPPPPSLQPSIQPGMYSPVTQPMRQFPIYGAGYAGMGAQQPNPQQMHSPMRYMPSYHSQGQAPQPPPPQQQQQQQHHQQQSQQQPAIAVPSGVNPQVMQSMMSPR